MFPTQTITKIVARNRNGTVKILHTKSQYNKNLKLTFLQYWGILPKIEKCGQPVLTDADRSILENTSYSTSSIPGKSETQCRLRTFRIGNAMDENMRKYEKI